MNSTTIHFNEKQDFSKVLQVIEQNFNLIAIKLENGKIIYVGFEFKGEPILAYFSKDNIIYHNDGRRQFCSSLSSDRITTKKTEAFKIIASKFGCKLWVDDHDETFIDFEAPKKEEAQNTRRSHIWVMRTETTFFNDEKSTHSYYAETIDALHEKAKEICEIYKLRFLVSTNPDHEFIFLDGESFHYGLPDESKVNPERKQITFLCTKHDVL